MNGIWAPPLWHYPIYVYYVVKYIFDQTETNMIQNSRVFALQDSFKDNHVRNVYTLNKRNEKQNLKTWILWTFNRSWQ